MRTAFPLPEDRWVDVSVLVRVFDDRTTSYKFYWFLALLELFEENEYNANRPISIKELVVRMLFFASFAYSNKLNLGKVDQFHRYLVNVNLAEDKKSSDRKNRLLGIIRSQLENTWKSLTRFVPYRFLTPFYAEVLKGISDAQKNKMIIHLSQKDDKAFYSIGLNESDIYINPAWGYYFGYHKVILEDYTFYQLTRYLENLNPTAVHISDRIRPQLIRSPLIHQTAFWKKVFQLDSSPWYCVYSDQVLDSHKFHLDHVLPWSFVGHDCMWNLIPVVPEVNSSKSNHLPSEKYIPEIASLHHRALLLTKNCSQWKNWTTEYIRDLQVSESDLLSQGILEQKMISLFEPQIQLAERQGFLGGWEYT